MIVTHRSGALKKFRRTPWRFQQTVEIPDGFDGAERFAAAIVAAHGRIDEATVTINEVVFKTERMTALCPAGTPIHALDKDSSLTARGDEVEHLLVAACIDAPDFIFAPHPKPFVFYSDHDSWTTFYANTKSHLNHIIEPLASQGYRLIRDWKREL